MTEPTSPPKIVLKIDVLLFDNGHVGLALPRPAGNAFDRAMYIGVLEQAVLAAITQIEVAPSPIVLARGHLPPVPPNGG